MVEMRTEQQTETPPPAFWETDVPHPEGGLWRVRTQDLEREPLQMPPDMIKVLVGNMGRFMTTVYGPGGDQYRLTYTPSRAEAEAYHDRVAERIRTGAM